MFPRGNTSLVLCIEPSQRFLVRCFDKGRLVVYMSLLKECMLSAHHPRHSTTRYAWSNIVPSFCLRTRLCKEGSSLFFSAKMGAVVGCVATLYCCLSFSFSSCFSFFAFFLSILSSSACLSSMSFWFSTCSSRRLRKVLTLEAVLKSLLPLT